MTTTKTDKYEARITALEEALRSMSGPLLIKSWAGCVLELNESLNVQSLIMRIDSLKRDVSELKNLIKENGGRKV